MKRYTLLRHDLRGNLDVVAEGWSGSAFLTGHLWALYHRLWTFFLVLAYASWLAGKAMAFFEAPLARLYGPAASADEIGQLILDFKIDVTTSTLALIPVLILAGAIGNRMLLRKRLQTGYKIVARGIKARNRADALLAENARHTTPTAA